jgi:hypothetical protein
MHEHKYEHKNGHKNELKNDMKMNMDTDMDKDTDVDPDTRPWTWNGHGHRAGMDLSSPIMQSANVQYRTIAALIE